MHPVNYQGRSLFFRRRWPVLGALVLSLLLIPSLSLASPLAALSPAYDLGDAPDSTNHFGVGMETFPGSAIKAFYPSVFDPATGLPQGPAHLSPGKDTWLGRWVTGELDADRLPDVDGITNIDPPANSANRDRYDDGVFTLSPSISLPQCAPTRFRYIVTGAGGIAAHRALVNVWFDFNRDGDWADKFTCVTASGLVQTVTEWAVKNQVVVVNPGSVVWATPTFLSAHRPVVTTSAPYTWMRISIAETTAPLNPATGLADGRGPANGYQLGESEDYFLKRCATCADPWSFFGS